MAIHENTKEITILAKVLNVIKIDFDVTCNFLGSDKVYLKNNFVNQLTRLRRF